MAIDIEREILNHSDPEIIAFLRTMLAPVKTEMNKAIKENKESISLSGYGALTLVYDILAALDRRNKENQL